MQPTSPPSESELATLVDRFYEKVRVDPELGPVFSPAVHDWVQHKQRLTTFWCSVARRSNSYRGNPMAAHQRHPVRAEHFDRWLTLWRATCIEVLDGATAALMIDYAERIGHSLKLGLGMRPRGRTLGVPIVSSRA